MNWSPRCSRIPSPEDGANYSRLERRRTDPRLHGEIAAGHIRAKRRTELEIVVGRGLNRAGAGRISIVIGQHRHADSDVVDVAEARTVDENDLVLAIEIAGRRIRADGDGV